MIIIHYYLYYCLSTKIFVNTNDELQQNTGKNVHTVNNQHLKLGI